MSDLDNPFPDRAAAVARAHPEEVAIRSNGRAEESLSDSVDESRRVLGISSADGAEEITLDAGLEELEAADPVAPHRHSEHHDDGIPPYDLPRDEYLEPLRNGRAVSTENDDAPSSYQANIENTSISAEGETPIAQGTVIIEEYKKDGFVCRITVDLSVNADRDMSMAAAHRALLDASIQCLQLVGGVDREVLKRSFIS